MLFNVNEVDTTGTSYKNVTDYLNTISNKTNAQEQLLVNSLTANRSLASAQTKLATLNTNTDFSKLNSTVVSALQTAAKLQTIVTDTTKQTQVRMVAACTQKQQSVACAQSLLQCLGLKNYTESIEIVLPASSNGLRLRNPNNNSNKTNLGSLITIYPNPTKEQFVLTQNLDVNNGEIRLTIFNLMGQKMSSEIISNNKTTINTKYLKSGIYIFTITQNGGVVKTDKLMVE